MFYTGLNEQPHKKGKTMQNNLIATLDAEIGVLEDELFMLRTSKLSLFAEWKANPSNETYRPLAENDQETFDVRLELSELKRQRLNASKGRTVVLKDTYNWS